MKTAKIQKDKTIIVYTPIPYVVDAYKDKEMNEISEVCNSLSQSVKFLRNCFKLLGITNKEAKEKKFTLNIETGEELNHRAWMNRNVSCEFCALLRNHKW